MRVPMATGWHLELYRKGGYRVYTTVDAAVSTAEAIGFREVSINWS